MRMWSLSLSILLYHTHPSGEDVRGHNAQVRGWSEDNGVGCYQPSDVIRGRIMFQTCSRLWVTDISEGKITEKGEQGLLCVLMLQEDNHHILSTGNKAPTGHAFPPWMPQSGLQPQDLMITMECINHTGDVSLFWGTRLMVGLSGQTMWLRSEVTRVTHQAVKSCYLWRERECER